MGWRQTLSHKHSVNVLYFSNNLKQNYFICNHKSDTFRMTKPQKNAIFKTETVLFCGKWNPCFSDTVRAEIKDTKSLPSGNNCYLWTMKVCLNNSSASTMQAPLIGEFQEFGQVHHWMYLSHSVAILPGTGIYGYIPMILLILKNNLYGKPLSR